MRIAAVGLTLIIVTGCATIEGMYEPSCMAMEGDTIELQGKAFTWKKYTDAVEIDASGNKVDPFPGYPMHGNYVRSGNEIQLHADSDQSVHTFYTLELDGEHYLLTAAQQGRYAVDGVVEGCALHRSEKSQ